MPTANGPCRLISPTSSRPTWPVRTIRTTSIASGLVTRRPPLNSLLMPEPAEHLVDLRATAVHDDRPQPGVAQEDDVLGEGGGQLGVDHRVAAVLHDDERAVEALQPGQRLDQHLRPWPAGQRRHGAHELYAEFSCT